MFKSYLNIALRNLWRQKAYSFINIAGLTVGLACGVLIMLYVLDELNYDGFHEDGGLVSRLVEILSSDGKIIEESASVPYPFAPALRSDYPEIEIVRLFRLQEQQPLVEFGDKRFYESQFFFADANVFEVFNFKLLAGDPETALAGPFSVILTEEMAQKYFGTGNPVGQTLLFENKFQFKVTGVLQNISHNSHLKFDFLASFASEEYILPGYGYSQNWLTNWYWNPCYTYLRFPGEDSRMAFESQLPAMAEKYYPERLRANLTFYLQQMTDIHLYSHIDNELAPNSSVVYVYILTMVMAFILALACINYMNLATARSASRAMEIGLRKAIGAHRRQIARQFLSEAIVTSVLSLILAVFVLELTLPMFNSFTGKELSLLSSGNVPVMLALLGLSLLVGLISGSYPALYLSGFRCSDVLKGSVGAFASGALMRKLLVVLQFAISIVMIIGTAIVHRQLEYIREKDLGFNKEAVLAMPIRETNLAGQYETFRNEILQNRNVLNVSATSDLLGRSGGTLVKPFRAGGRAQEEVLHWPGFAVDHNFVQTLDMRIVSGRDFSREYSTDAEGAFLLNEAAVAKLGWEEPLGKRFSIGRTQGAVVGVVKDFNLFSLHRPVEPVVLYIDPGWYRYILVRLQSQELDESISFLESKWAEFVPQRPFEYSFLDKDFDALYKSEKKLGRVFSFFSLFAIFIACMGLFGLASFMTEQRTKEVGIRKVLGASVSNIVVHLSRDFTRWVLLSNLVAWPVAYFGMNYWLQDFAFRADISLWVFLLSALLAFAIAILTTAIQTIRAALRNPVDSLRYE